MSQIPDVEDVAAALQMSIGLCIRQLRRMDAEGDLSLPEISVLKRLDRVGSSSVTELAKAEQISVQSIGTTLGGSKHVASYSVSLIRTMGGVQCFRSLTPGCRR